MKTEILGMKIYFDWLVSETLEMMIINPLSDETDLTNLMGSPKSVTVEAVGNHSFTSSSPGSQARPILARLLSPNIQNQSTFSRIQPPTNRKSRE
jgi:hypothetical protein